MKKPVVVQKQTLQIVDTTCAIFLNPKTSTSSARIFSLAENILDPHQIPLIEANTDLLVFSKENGDKVTLSRDKLIKKYNIILFNRVDDPVVLRIADLENACNQLFGSEMKTKPTQHAQKKHIKTIAISQDTVSRVANLIQRLLHRQKKFVIAIADTSSSSLYPRTIPGIEWVEQRVDTRTILKFDFSNDLLTYNNTDRYFTNGISLHLQSARLERSAFSKLMIPYRHKAVVSYNTCLVQDMFTPTDTRVAPTLSHDRPYASYLFVGYRKSYADAFRRLTISSQVDFGYIGPYSPGSFMQNMVHKIFPTNDKPQGWETQLRTDVILNYNLQASKLLVNTPFTNLLMGFDVKAGTLYDQAGATIDIKTGKSASVMGFSDKEQWPKYEFYIFTKAGINYVAYNALLQGGVLNKNNIFTLKANEIEHITVNTEIGLHARYKGVGIELAQHFLSPEYKKGLWHKWGRIGLLFRL